VVGVTIDDHETELRVERGHEALRRDRARKAYGGRASREKRPAVVNTRRKAPGLRAHGWRAGWLAASPRLARALK
jgi:hypothetical protein